MGWAAAEEQGWYPTLSYWEGAIMEVQLPGHLHDQPWRGMNISPKTSLVDQGCNFAFSVRCRLKQSMVRSKIPREYRLRPSWRNTRSI